MEVIDRRTEEGRKKWRSRSVINLTLLLTLKVKTPSPRRVNLNESAVARNQNGSEAL
jgi:hypothetical protein